MNAARYADPAASRTPATISLPMEFLAFCELHRPRYLSYALLHTGDEHQADHVVQKALGDLVIHWGQALASSNVAGYAWPLLKHHLARHTATTPVRPLLRTIPADVSDEMLLREGLQLDEEQIAETTGRLRVLPARRPQQRSASAIAASRAAGRQMTVGDGDRPVR
ncbi:hypothetical protein OG689_44130 [Kitasatospora sp. NBC_00240]|uniref:hypothetical protein n=1 Tax=Kitasatospora sp. NBC_00240 TaxID=2903567 RepID=UPI002254BD88|nr:hypothetical protein [Kitasatospora sp. NBC_00240]MCX5216126.1 hypothetical protein [Kitasatospora sp. NBC_00240]